MCIVYRKKITKEIKARKGEITVYKVYRIDTTNKLLLSRYFAHTKSGIIKRSGTYKADNSWSSAIGNKIGSQYGKPVSLRSIKEKNEGMEVYGFHCFLTRKSAEYFQHNRCRLSSAIVELTVNTKDLIIGGYEKFGRKKQLKSGTFKEIHISREEFVKATTPTPQIIVG